MSTLVPKVQLAEGLFISPILNGLWQTAGGHGKIDLSKAITSMWDLQQKGFTSFDGADHYGPAEDLMGVFKEQYEKKFGQETLSTNFQDYDNNQYLTALKHMKDLQKEGKIKHIGLTNFDTEHMAIIVENGITIVSNQVSYSIIDRRPENKMIEFCKKHNIKLLTYGTLLGGFFSEKYLGAPEPSKAELNTWSLSKYKRFIDSFGTWSLFQEVLAATKKVADKHKVSIANVATRYILDKPCVGGVIVGARLGLSEHTEDNLKVFSFKLDEQDVKEIEQVVKKGKMLPGDCGDEYR